MSSRLLAIDLKNGLLTAIAFTVDARVMHVTGHAVVQVAARPMEEALTELSRKIDFHDATCHVALAAESFFYRNLSVPFTDSKTINKILPLELEEKTPVKIDRLLIDFIVSQENRPHSQIIAAMIDRELLTARLTALQALGVDPETVTISGIPTALCLLNTPDRPADFLLLDIDLQEATCILVRSGHICLIRPLAFDPGLAAGFQISPENTVVALRPENIDTTFQTFCTAIFQALQSSDTAHEPTGLAVYLSGSVGSLAGTAECIEAGLGDLCLSCSLAASDPTAMEGGVSELPKMAPDRPSCQLVPPAEGTWHPGVMADAVNLGWQAVKNWKSFNLRKEAFATRKSFSGSRNQAIAITLPLLTAAMLAILYLWYDYAQLLKEKKGLDAQIQAVFIETLPDVTRIVDPVQQLRVKIQEAGQTSTGKDGALPPINILTLLTEVSANIPEPLDVRLNRFVVDDNGLRLKGSTDTFNTVDAIKKGLEQSPIFSNVEISAANLDPKSSKVRFELKLTMKGS